jgi:ABC-type Fe3+-hydroxamate transport system substrate-binding protein
MMDAIEQVLSRLNGPPRRVVSLVPSYTQSLFDLGFGGSVVGVTDYCTHPRNALNACLRLGGPKTVRVEDIRALRPDLVLANREENEREQILALEAAGINVWLTFPRTVASTFAFLADLAGLYADQAALTRMRLLEDGFEWARQAAGFQPPQSYFCPIWQDTDEAGRRYWMTFNRDTYSGDLLDQLGGSNVFAQRERHYPLAADLGDAPTEPPAGRDTRYPRVSLAEVLAAQPEVILLPDEPYDFDPASEAGLRELLADTPAVRSGRVYRLEGRWVTWCGTCIGEAIQEIPGLFANPLEE